MRSMVIELAKEEILQNKDVFEKIKNEVISGEHFNKKCENEKKDEYETLNNDINEKG